MRLSVFDFKNIPLILCGLFYCVLSIFSIVTGMIYMSGKRKLNPLELPDSFVDKLSEEGKTECFARKMGLVTFIVGIVQGISAFCLFHAKGILAYMIALGFTLFSIASVSFKLKGKINAFPLLKLGAYLLILIVLFLTETRNLFFR